MGQTGANRQGGLFSFDYEGVILDMGVDSHLLASTGLKVGDQILDASGSSGLHGLVQFFVKCQEGDNGTQVNLTVKPSLGPGPGAAASAPLRTSMPKTSSSSGGSSSPSDAEAELKRIRDALATGSQKVDQLFTMMHKMEQLHAETSDGFSETLVKAYGKILEEERN